ncbi:MAG: hydroxymethylglutaryl-CoA lyase [Saprospiraceae bacterium]|nr:hydroxymethylglutaryl-CoA lyase [Saprospiraceae bacterium]
MQKVKIIECPRDAMQGMEIYIGADDKARYINQLLKVGFDTIDFGSFVSPKAIPQMRDTAEVLSKLDLSQTKSKLLAIVANFRGAQDAVLYPEIGFLGYPFSISETFQMRNTNATIQESVEVLDDIQELCVKHGKKLVVYLSMGFGNPYGDVWNVDICAKWVAEMQQREVEIIALSDTIGIANPESISYLFSSLVPAYPKMEFGAHFHTRPLQWREKIHAANEAGCTRFDAAIKGYGGCPMAKDDLTGNMPTENLLYYFDEMGVDPGLDELAFIKAMSIANEIFPK